MTVLVLSALVVMGCDGGSGTTPGKKIALLLPESTTALNVRSFFEAHVKQVCSNCEVLYRTAKTDGEQQTQAATAISSGASVMVLEPVHGAAAAPIVAQAKAAKIPVIAYERLVLSTADLSYYVSFDRESEGGLLASSLLTAMGTKTNPTIVEINGDPADSNTKTFKQSALAVLTGKVRFGAQYDTPGGAPAAAKTEIQSSLVALDYKVDGVLAATDAIAGSAILAMKGQVRPWPAVAGQGATLGAIQHIVTGDQYMTLYMSTKAEAEAAAQLAYDLAFGVSVFPTLSGGKTVNNGTADVPAVLLMPVVVTKVNIESTVVGDGFLSADEICTSQFASACAAAGIS